jgi:hypothetical protein
MMPEWLGGAALGSGLGLPPADQWKAQWARVRRWHQRVERIREKALMAELDAFDLDEVIAYLQNCYHLRDWLEASRPALKVQLDAFFQKHFELGACRDVCNGFKHKAVKRPSHDPDFNLYREYDHLLEDAEPGRSPVVYRIAFADGVGLRKFDLFEFTNTCLALWRDFVAREVQASTKA